MAKKEQATWLGKPIFEQAHAADLERAAAILEFGHGLPREEAEKRAHEQYRTDHHAKAAAHHITKMKAARATGSFDAAAQHSTLYTMHLKALGKSPFDGVPPEVQAHINDLPTGTELAEFAPHGADMYLLHEEPKTTP